MRERSRHWGHELQIYRNRGQEMMGGDIHFHHPEPQERLWDIEDVQKKLCVLQGHQESHTQAQEGHMPSEDLRLYLTGSYVQSWPSQSEVGWDGRATLYKHWEAWLFFKCLLSIKNHSAYKRTGKQGQFKRIKANGRKCLWRSRDTGPPQ